MNIDGCFCGVYCVSSKKKREVVIMVKVRFCLTLFFIEKGRVSVSKRHTFKVFPKDRHKRFENFLCRFILSIHEAKMKEVGYVAWEMTYNFDLFEECPWTPPHTTNLVDLGYFQEIAPR